MTLEYKLCLNISTLFVRVFFRSQSRPMFAASQVSQLVILGVRRSLISSLAHAL